MEVVLCLLCALYLAPFVVAARHDHERLGWILAVNLLLGWTGIGWLLALRWARRPAPPAPEPVVVARRGHLRLLAAPDQHPDLATRRRPTDCPGQREPGAAGG
jgi:Superinfection immunity protein